jgi:hypothetical protein
MPWSAREIGRSATSLRFGNGSERNERAGFFHCDVLFQPTAERESQGGPSCVAEAVLKGANCSLAGAVLCGNPPSRPQLVLKLLPDTIWKLVFSQRSLRLRAELFWLRPLSGPGFPDGTKIALVRLARVARFEACLLRCINHGRLVLQKMS